MSINVEALRLAERDLPMPDPVTRPYWEALNRGEFLLQRCVTCGQAQYYPRAICSHCAGDVEWFTASGRGAVHTFSIVRMAFAEPFSSLVPYVFAVVELDEGPLVLTNIIGCPIDDVRIGTRVRLEPVKASDEITLPFWVLED